MKHISLLLSGICVFPVIFSGQGAEKPALLMLGEAKVVLLSSGAKQTYVRPFELAVRGSNWWMTTYSSPDKMGDTDFHWQVFNISDGLLAQCHFHPKVGRLIVILKPLIAPVSCPDYASHFIWLTLTASVQAGPTNRVLVPPIYNASADSGTNPDLRSDCEVEYLDAHRLWPKHIRFFNTGTFNRHSAGVNSTQRYQAPYDKGFLEARFEAVSITNWNGMKVPMRIVGETLGPSNHLSSGKLQTNVIVEITVTEIEALPAEVKLPPPPDVNMSINDSRAPYAPNQMVGFTVDDGKWPTLEQSQAVAEKAKRERGLLPK